MRLKIVSFNMKRTLTAGARNHWLRRREAILAFFSAEAPDIVGTQEMIKPYIRSAETLLPQYGWVGEGRGGGGQGEFTAIFYRKDKLRVVDWGTFWLSREPEKPGSRAWFTLFPRTCTWALLESVDEGRKVCVYNTHLDHISTLARLRGLQLIKRHIGERLKSCADIVLMGDFNAGPRSAALRFLLEHTTSPSPALLDTVTVSEGGRTYHGFRGKAAGAPIDYIFATPSLNVLEGYVDRNIYEGRYPSDHYPVVAVFDTPSM